METIRSLTLILAAALLQPHLGAQTATLQRVQKVVMPVIIDGNSPAYWDNGNFVLFSSTGNPEMIHTSPGQFGPWESDWVDTSDQVHMPMWVEAVWRDEDGTLFGWYHHEPHDVCRDNDLTAPKIGAVISFDGGRTFKDLGIVLESGEPADCNAKNGFFAGGHGDFSVVPDREKKYFYFLFTNYGGDASQQGIVAARLAFEDRFQPAGAAYKYYQGEWAEPGIGGRMTAIYPSAVVWGREDADSLWGPSTHYNRHLDKYVLLMNRACCRPGWPQEGIYVAYATDLSNPNTWTDSKRLLDKQGIGFSPGFYPQVLGLEEGDTDSLAGQTARLYIHGISNWEITFQK
ncbi:MAG: hypothetical protein JNL62_14660 [Bryobacterales bacterium]|nr:hypothetical protein [Bryobacterales bacterium]